MMSKKLLTVVVFLAVVGATTFACVYAIFGRSWIRAGQLREQSAAMHGQSRRSVVQKFGNPTRTYSKSQYAEMVSHGPIGGLKPQPPHPDCDEVLEYFELATIVMFYVKDNKVITTYVGGT